MKKKRVPLRDRGTISCQLHSHKLSSNSLGSTWAALLSDFEIEHTYFISQPCEEIFSQFLQQFFTILYVNNLS